MVWPYYTDAAPVRALLPKLPLMLSQSVMLALPLWICVMWALRYLQDALKRFHIPHSVIDGVMIVRRYSQPLP